MCLTILSYFRPSALDPYQVSSFHSGDDVSHSHVIIVRMFTSFNTSEEFLGGWERLGKDLLFTRVHSLPHRGDLMFKLDHVGPV